MFLVVTAMCAATCLYVSMQSIVRCMYVCIVHVININPPYYMYSTCYCIYVNSPYHYVCIIHVIVLMLIHPIIVYV